MPSPLGAPREPGPGPDRRAALAPLVAPLAYAALAIAAVGAIGLGYYERERAVQEREAAREISTLAELQARHVAAWRRERLGDARLHTHALLRVAHVRQILESGASQLAPETAGWLAKIREAYGYASVLLVDRGGRTALASGAELGPLPPAARALALRAMAAGEVVSDLAGRNGAAPHLLVASAFRADEGGGGAFGALVLRIAMDDAVAFPEIGAAADLGSATGSLLLRREGDDVVSLAPLRGRERAPLRLPADAPGQVEAAATEPDAPPSVWGRDHAGEPVIAAARAVPGTDWFVLSKLDARKILQPARREALLVASASGGLALVVALGMARTRQREEDRHRELELRSAYLSQFAPDAILLADTNARILDANERALEMFGLAREELLGRHGSELLEPEDAARFDELRDRALAGEPVELIGAHADGSTFPMEVTARRIHFDGADYLVAVARDTCERHAAAARIDAANRRFRAVFENANDAILIAEGDRVLACNARAEQLFGVARSEILAKGLDAVGIDWTVLQEARTSIARRGGGGASFSQRLERPAGDSVEAEIAVSRFALDRHHHTVVIARNVSEQRRLEERQRQAQKMEALGQLAGGIAHDFNNLLTAIVGYTEILELELAEDAPRRDMLAEIRHSAELGGALTSKLLAFSRAQEHNPRVVDVNEVVRGLEGLLRRLIGEDVRLETRLATAPLPVRIDPGQFEQILVNLAVNARDAMPRGGTLSIETAPHRSTTAPTDGVRVRVADTGEGMSAEVRWRALEPFFTTKEPGRGTGLGLSTVYGIARQSGGRMEIESAPGRGTCVDLWLPRSREAPDTSREAPSAAVGGSETVLLVEDSAPVRRVAVAGLEAAGYRVVVATEPDEAIGLVRRHPEAFDLIVTDVVMPGMSGVELVRSLRAIRPDLPALYVSGYAPHEILERVPDDDTVELLGKPFTPTALAARVRKLLDAT